VPRWRVLDPTHLDAVLKAIRIRQEHSDYILSVARQSASTGEPIVRSMEYAFPHQGYERVNDQFLLGDLILVAPVLEKGASQRAVMLPAGAWKGIDGKQYAVPCRIVMPVAPDQPAGGLLFDRVQVGHNRRREIQPFLQNGGREALFASGVLFARFDRTFPAPPLETLCRPGRERRRFPPATCP